MFNPQNNIIYIWRGILIVSSLALLIYLFYQNLVPSGVLVLEHKKGDPNSKISDLTPEKRVIYLPEDGENQRFFIDPVYFDVKTPRVFDKVKIKLAWQNQSQPILEIGARKSRSSFAFVLKPLQNKIIDKLTWSCERYDQILFCQKQKNFSSLSEFLANLPIRRVLTYHYDLGGADKLNVATDINDYDYLVSTYTPPQSLGNNWFAREVEFNWNDFEVHINEISFVLSAPALNDGGGQIVVGDIVATLRRPPLDWQGFVEYLKEQGRRIKK